MFKCIELLNTNNDKTVRSLAKYVFEAFRMRSLSVSWYICTCIICYALAGERGGRGGYRRSLVAPLDVFATFTAADGDLALDPCLIFVRRRNGGRQRNQPNGDRVWSARSPISPSVPTLNSVFCVLCHHVGLSQFTLPCVWIPWRDS